MIKLIPLVLGFLLFALMWDLRVDSSSLMVDGDDVWRGGLRDGKIYKSQDYGRTWQEKYQYTVGWSEVMLLWKASNGYFFSSRAGSNILIRSMDGGETWNTVLEGLGHVPEQRPDLTSFWSMTEGSGNIYAGQYSHGNGQEECAYIFKSSDYGDTWEVVYQDEARHIHKVVYDPYQDLLYTTQGDWAEDAKFLKSGDSGQTWEVIREGETLWKFTVIMSCNGYRLLGTDNTTGRIYKTTDDVNFEVAYQPPPEHDQVNWYWASRSRDGLVVFGGQCEGQSVDNPILVATLDGETWEIVDEVERKGSSTGFWAGSQFTKEGFIYYQEKRDSVLDGTTIRALFLKLNKKLVIR